MPAVGAGQDVRSSPCHKQQSPSAAISARPRIFSRRVRTPDGRWEDDPRGPVKAKIQLFGRNAEIVHRLGMQQGDPVIAGGTLADPAAFVSPRDGEMDARTVINAAWLVFDSIRVEQRRARDDSTDSGQSAAGPSMYA